MTLQRLLRAACLFVVVALLAAGVFAWSALNSEVPTEADGRIFEIEPGSSMTRVAANLQADGLLESPRILTLYARFSGQAEKIQAGEYLLEAGQTPLDMLNAFVDGNVLLHSITLLEGWTVKEVLNALNRHPAVTLTLPENADVASLGKELGLSHEHAEGLFYPETYSFPKGTPDTELLLQAAALLDVELAAAWEARAGGIPIKTPYELLTLASIIERETSVDDERGEIAGVFIRRLQQRMRLQTDPTVIYGLGDAYQGDITRKHLKTDTPYNTYTRHGLPPTPIGLVSRASLQAAANPEPGTSLYFVATGDGSGRHTFSDTLEEHNRAVADYLKKTRRR